MQLPAIVYDRAVPYDTRQFFRGWYGRLYEAWEELSWGTVPFVDDERVAGRVNHIRCRSELAIRTANRRTKQHNVSAYQLSNFEWRLIQYHYKYQCVYCGSKEKITLEHIQALSRGGDNTPQNIVPACHLCNTRKRDRNVTKSVQPLLCLY